MNPTLQTSITLFCLAIVVRAGRNPCRKVPDGHLIPNLLDCGGFLECFNGHVYEHRCSHGLHFNAKVGVCDYPVNAGCDINPKHKTEGRSNKHEVGYDVPRREEKAKQGPRYQQVEHPPANVQETVYNQGGKRKSGMDTSATKDHHALNSPSQHVPAISSSYIPTYSSPQHYSLFPEKRHNSGVNRPRWDKTVNQANDWHGSHWDAVSTPIDSTYYSHSYPSPNAVSFPGVLVDGDSSKAWNYPSHVDDELVPYQDHVPHQKEGHDWSTDHRKDQDFRQKQQRHGHVTSEDVRSYPISFPTMHNSEDYDDFSEYHKPIDVYAPDIFFTDDQHEPVHMYPKEFLPETEYEPGFVPDIFQMYMEDEFNHDDHSDESEGESDYGEHSHEADFGEHSHESDYGEHSHEADYGEHSHESDPDEYDPFRAESKPIEIYLPLPEDAYETQQPYEHKPAITGQHKHKPSSNNQISDVMVQAVKIATKYLEDETRNVRRMENVQDSLAFSYVSAFLNAKPDVKLIAKSAMVNIAASRILKDRFGYDDDKMRSTHLLRPYPGVAVPDKPLNIPEDMNVCPYPHEYACDATARYRTFDGSCNNLQNPILGRTMVPFRRLLSPVYDDGLEEFRRSVRGGPLPGARDISLNLFPDIDLPSGLHTLMVVAFGQFIDHDLTHTPITKAAMDGLKMKEMEEVRCGMDGCDSGKPGLRACRPIPIPQQDHDFRFNSCLKFVRSQEVPNLDCTLGPREQMNQVTSWLDSSTIYGSSLEDARSLRDFSNSGRGGLLMTPHPHGPYLKPLLPQDDVPLCRNVTPTRRCFAAGDARVNEQVPLTSLHVAFARQHNRIESSLNLLNPHWSGERLYQETRRIISAQMQHIVFNELLPIILGRDLVSQFGLELEKNGFYNGYDPKVNPISLNEFATAAYRFGHTLITERIRRANKKFQFDDSLFLSAAFRHPTPIYDTARGGVDSLLRGMSQFPCQTFDTVFTKQISVNLFTEAPPNTPSMDLLSLNIQRGRDHGLPGYNAFREYCGFGRAYTFDDLSGTITDPANRANLQKMYKHVDDIDLFAGGVAEEGIRDGVIGPTFGCIVADQFRGNRQGDRFWYENKNEVGFTAEQLREIRKSLLSQMLCINSDDVTVTQPFVLWTPTTSPPVDFSYSVPSFDIHSHHHHPRDFNPHVTCSSLPDIDLSFWAE